MASSEITHVSLFEIGTDRYGQAAYSYRVDLNVDPGTHAQRIEEYKNDPQLRAAARAAHSPSFMVGDLDVDEARTEGLCIYTFYLNAEVDGQQRLLFVETGPRFINIPINSTTGEAFLTEVEGDAGDRRWASFTCDLGEVRDSELFTRIRTGMAHGAAHHHRQFLKIPFSLNVVDPLWGVAPWTFPDEELVDPGIRAELTHGGVHPRPVAFVNLAL